VEALATPAKRVPRAHAQGYPTSSAAAVRYALAAAIAGTREASVAVSPSAPLAARRVIPRISVSPALTSAPESRSRLRRFPSV